MKKMSYSAVLSSKISSSSSSSSSSNSTSIIEQNFASNFLAGDQEGVSFNYLSGILEHYEIPSSYDAEKLEHLYVPDRWRRYMNDMIRFVFYLHDYGKSLDQLEESNIVLVSHQPVKKLKFRGLKFVATSPEKKKRDFLFIHRILMNKIEKQKMIFSNDLSIPADLMDLLSLLKDYSDSDGHRELLSNHLAILPSRQRLELINNFSKKAGFVPDAKRGNYWSAVRGLQRREIYQEDWTEWFKDPLGFQVGPAKDCFEFDGGGGANYRGTGSPQQVNCDILRFCRNMATHLQDHIAKHRGGSKGTELDVDLIIMALFDEELLSFQRLAHRYGVLEKRSRSAEFYDTETKQHIEFYWTANTRPASLRSFVEF
ncbi:hypothetical protein C2S53_010971 [Perilla frutescens var. hirtella]|uniref:Uncharacterized protein n=1 Tax=Perilla frutescens var. hirtella TaxID=608512 RepID=A0AAD4JDS9_PERFH|nr:hypothetical protein C2S53_010971 [Perilla frutescens var. hirtella]